MRDDQALVFAYLRDYGVDAVGVPLSSRWPVDGGERTHLATDWIENLLPENPEVRRSWAVSSGAPSTAAFDMLATDLGLDCAGAVQFSLDAEQLEQPAQQESPELLTDDQLAQIVSDTARRVSLENDRPPDDHGFTLAGAQRKVALGIEPSTGRCYRPTTALPSTHIFKPVRLTLGDDTDTGDFPNLVVVEHLTMRTARECGIGVAHTSLRQFGGHVAIVVERYDRSATGTGVARRHQEDLCQAFGLPPSRKFESRGGPTAALIAHRLSELGDHSHRRFFEALVFNWVVAGSDAHSKNYSILLASSQQSLAPLYDLTSALPFSPPQHQNYINLSMQAAAPGYAVGDFDAATVWADTAASCRVSVPDALETMEQVVHRASSAARAAVDSLAPDFQQLPQVVDYVPAVDRRAQTAERVVDSFKSMVRPPRQTGRG